MKKLLSFMLTIVMMTVLFVPQTAFAQEYNKKAEFEKLLKWAENKGFEIKGNRKDVDYNKLDLQKIRKQLEVISSIGKEINMEENIQLKTTNTYNSPSILKSPDQKIVSKLVTKTYEGNKTYDGENYDYKVYVYIDYDYLYYNGRPEEITKINNLTSDGGQATFIREYTHDTGTEVTSISSDRKRGYGRAQGVFNVGIDDLELNWRVLFKVSFRVGEGRYI
ncbi:MAG: hypothetical protein N4A64_10645 [Marinisporobacter sp.]|jgi:hypothetical protein|nr:hypothetical protein [Marinisporobacter sp.]